MGGETEIVNCERNSIGGIGNNVEFGLFFFNVVQVWNYLHLSCG